MHPDKPPSIAAAIAHKPAPQRYRCYADDCPMAGTIFEGGPDGPGVCAFHYGVPPLEVRRVTQTLLDWHCIAQAIRASRRALIGPSAADGAHHAATMREQWSDLRATVDPQWWPELEPGNLRVRDRTRPEGYRTLPVTEGLGDWSKRLERFLGARVLEVRNVTRRPGVVAQRKTGSA